MKQTLCMRTPFKLLFFPRTQIIGTEEDGLSVEKLPRYTGLWILGGNY